MNYSVDRMDNYQPSGEPVETHQGGTWTQSPRARLFLLVFGVLALIGLVWVFMQPSVYRSSASVLVSAPQALGSIAVQADIENVAIQARILLGDSVVSRTRLEFNEKHGERLQAQDLASMLSVRALPDTNLVVMSAQSSEGELLPSLLNIWIDVYMHERAAAVDLAKTRTSERAQGELHSLEKKLGEGRRALAEFRQQHNIISGERQESEILARLEGTIQSLNSAVEAEVLTRVHLQAMEAALQRGERIVPRGEERGLDRLETELQALQAEMTALNRRYTPQYINKQPELRVVQERIAELEEEIEIVLAQGQKSELAGARVAHSAAVQAVEELQQELAERERIAAQFSGDFATYQALLVDLERLEAQHRERRTRIVEVDVRDVTNYPEVSLIDRPGEFAARVGQDTLLQSGVVLAASMIAAVVAVWLYGFLGHRPAPAAYVTLSGVHMYPPDNDGAISHQMTSRPGLAEASQARLGRQKEGAADGAVQSESAAEPARDKPR